MWEWMRRKHAISYPHEVLGKGNLHFHTYYSRRRYVVWENNTCSRKWRAGENPNQAHLPDNTPSFSANDSLFFIKINEWNASSLVTILYTYNRVSGQSINLSKSCAFLVRNTITTTQTKVESILGVGQPQKPASTWVSLHNQLFKWGIAVSKKQNDTQAFSFLAI